MMLEKIGEAAMYEQLAEEATELAQAALKVSRLIRGENKPRNKTRELCDMDVMEEFTDLFMIAYELKLRVNMEMWRYKEDRFLTNWKAEHTEENDSYIPPNYDPWKI